MNPENKITHISINGSSYSLLQYLLLQDIDVSKNHTYYFFGDGIASSIRKNFQQCTYFPTKPVAGIKQVRRSLYKIYLRILGWHKYKFIKDAEIYAQDYLYPAILIGKKEYSLLQESPYHLTVNNQEGCTDYIKRENKRKSLSGKIEKFLYGEVLVQDLGCNPQCTTIHLTEENESPSLSGKNVEIHSLAELWKNSSPEKKEFICSIFNIDNTYNSLFKEKDTIFLTQPLVDDGILTTQEYIEMLTRLFAKYDESRLCIKVHPRDSFKYNEFFPKIAIYESRINLELLFLVGLNLKKVISICSTAVNCVPPEIEVDWLGTSFNKNLEARLGNSIVPFRAYNQINI